MSNKDWMVTVECWDPLPGNITINTSQTLPLHYPIFTATAAASPAGAAGTFESGSDMTILTVKGDLHYYFDPQSVTNVNWDAILDVGIGVFPQLPDGTAQLPFAFDMTLNWWGNGIDWLWLHSWTAFNRINWWSGGLNDVSSHSVHIPVDVKSKRRVPEGSCVALCQAWSVDDESGPRLEYWHRLRTLGDAHV